MTDDPFDDYGSYFRNFYPCISQTISKPQYPYSGSFDDITSPLPKGFLVFYQNAKYYPMFDGATYRVILDFGNGTIIFYPSGFIEVQKNTEYLGLQIYFQGELLVERKI